MKLGKSHTGTLANYLNGMEDKKVVDEANHDKKTCVECYLKDKDCGYTEDTCFYIHDDDLGE